MDDTNGNCRLIFASMVVTNGKSAFMKVKKSLIHASMVRTPVTPRLNLESMDDTQAKGPGIYVNHGGTRSAVEVTRTGIAAIRVIHGRVRAGSSDSRRRFSDKRGKALDSVGRASPSQGVVGSSPIAPTTLSHSRRSLDRPSGVSFLCS